MNWSQVYSIFFFSLSSVAMVSLLYTSFRVWQSYRRVMAREEEVFEQLERMEWLLEHDPEGLIRQINLKYKASRDPKPSRTLQ